MTVDRIRKTKTRRQQVAEKLQIAEVTPYSSLIMEGAKVNDNCKKIIIKQEMELFNPNVEKDCVYHCLQRCL